MDGALGAAGTNAMAVGYDKMATQGVLYRGLDVLGGGSILTGLVLAAIGVFAIERELAKASAFALAGAVLTYFGFMHGGAVGVGNGFGVTPSVAIAYAVVAAFLYALSRKPAFVAIPDAVPAE
jgi:AGZA family xanthine/uracil permease-like MFS transporter